jgi:hypothetical protein
MNRTTLTLATTLALAAAAALCPPAPAAATPPTQPSTVLDHARQLPALPVVDGAVPIPLRNSEPMAWRPIRKGVTASGGERLKVAYTRTRGQAAGAAIVVKPGTFDGLESINVAVAGNRSQTLFVNLTQADGSVWTLGPVNVRTGEPREVVLRAEDIELDPYQNRGRKDAAFDAASVYMLTLLDISGHMSASEPECEWTVSSLKAVRR